MQRQHPDSAFLLHVEGGKDVETFQVASRQLSNIFMQPGWDQHVLQQLRQMEPGHCLIAMYTNTDFLFIGQFSVCALPPAICFTTPTLASASPEVVVPIRPSSSAHAQPYAYWTDGTFVLYNAISGQLRCSQDSHKGQCPHIKAVNSHMQENGSDAFDDDEQDYSQAWASKMDRQWLFRCPECGDAPPVLVGDAAAKSIQKKFYCGQSVTEPQAGSVPQARPHTRAQRCLFAAAADRRLIGAFASSVRNDGRTAFGHQNLSPAQQF
ncbi:hypothetical protein WJX77_008904 [Trebouxia sp. C0004]